MLDSIQYSAGSWVASGAVEYHALAAMGSVRCRLVIDIALTRRADGYHVARALQLPEVVVEANSREGALSRMRQALLDRRRAGVELVQLDWGDLQGEAAAGWPRHSGAFPDDAVYREMLGEVERERKRADHDALV